MNSGVDVCSGWMQGVCGWMQGRAADGAHALQHSVGVVEGKGVEVVRIRARVGGDDDEEQQEELEQGHACRARKAGQEGEGPLSRAGQEGEGTSP